VTLIRHDVVDRIMKKGGTTMADTNQDIDWATVDVATVDPLAIPWAELSPEVSESLLARLEKVQDDAVEDAGESFVKFEADTETVVENYRIHLREVEADENQVRVLAEQAGTAADQDAAAMADLLQELRSA
jgi:hypothetical protein